MMHGKMLYGYRNTTAIVRDPVSIGTAIATSIGVTGAVGTALVIGATYVGISLATSWALNALAPKPDFGGSGLSGLLVNQKSPLSPHEFVYGQVRKGGVVTYYETTGTNNRFLHQIITLAGHEVDEIGDIYLNDEVVTVDPVTGLVGGDWANRIRIKKYRGNQTTADPDLVAESSQVGSSFAGRDIAYLYVRYAFDADVFANGLPLITAVVRGKRVYDPRTDTTAYSNNAALCIRDYLTSAYGTGGTVNDTMLSVAANVCDEAVPLSGGGTEPRYTTNGVIKAGTEHADALSRLMTSCAGTLFWGAGEWRLSVGAYNAPTKALTVDDLRSEISLTTRTSLRDQFNYVQGTFNNAEARWITVDYPPVKSAVFAAEDGGEETGLDLELPMTTSPPSAQRIAKLTLFRAREQMTLTAEFGLGALDVQIGEIVSLTIDRYGWDAKEFEVIGWKFGANQQAGDLRVTLTLRETSEAAFDWNAEESAIIANNTSLLSPFDVPSVVISPEGIVPSLRIVREKLTEVISINVTSGRPEAVDHVEVQFAAAGTNDWKALGSGSLGVYEVVDVEPGAYKFRARAVNSFGRFGSYTETGNIQTAGSSLPPDDVTELFYEINDGTTTLEWDPIADLDLSFYRIRHAVEQTGATWANATTAVDKVPRPGTSVALPTRPGTYMIRAYDKTGLASQSSIAVTISPDEVPSYTQTLTQQEDAGFTGTKTGCEVSGVQLQITDPSAAPSEATYDFSTHVETHDAAVRRIRARVDAAVLRVDESAGLWDDLPGVFDELPGLFDDFTGIGQFADTNLLFYISTTPDDPAGTPVWSDYQQFRAGEFYGRAFRFRVVLRSTSDAVTPAITALSAIVEYD